MANDEMAARLRDLIQLTQQAARLLRAIAQEGRDTGEDLHDADRAADVLQARLPRMLEDVADPAALDFRKKAQSWGSQMGSIDRIVDAIYPGRYQAVQSDLQNRISNQALWLDNEKS